MRFLIDPSQFMKEVERKSKGLVEISRPRTQEAIAKAVFAISANDFMKHMKEVSLKDPKSFHHVYEWGKVGVNKYKLFSILRKGVKGGNLVVGYRFNESKTIVPIHPYIKNNYDHHEHIFRDKARVMEANQPTKFFTAKWAKALVIPPKSKNAKGPFIFIKPPRGFVVMRPGGIAVKGSFEKEFKLYFKNTANVRRAIRATGFYKDLELTIARALRPKGASDGQVRLAVIEMANKYSKGLVEV